MAARNEITGDLIATKAASDAYRDNFDAIFRKKVKIVVEVLCTSEEQEAKDLRKEQTAAWWVYCEKNQKQLEPLLSFEEFRSTL